MPERPSTRILVAVGLVAACTLALQVVLTRLFSAVLAYHFSFLAISLALVGTGAGALLVYLVPSWFERPSLEHVLARWCALFGVLLLVIPFALVRLNFTQGGGVGAQQISGRFVVNLAVACLLAALPSIAAGAVIAVAINGYTQYVGRVYAFDLVGAGLGAFVVVPLMWVADAPTLLVGVGLAAVLAALLFSPSAARERRVLGALAAVACAVVVISATTSVLFVPPRFPVGDAPRVSDRWNPLSRVVAYEHGLGPFSAAFYDRDVAPVPDVRGGEIPDWRALGTGPQSVAYELTGPGRALIIGGGGGRDIYNALSSGAERVDVIELNEGMRKAVDEDLAQFSGSPYSRPGVHTSIGDGRSVLASRDTKYDVVHIGFTNTLSGSSAAGYVLTENNLYTVEAFREYLDHLEDDGVLAVSRVRKLAGDEAIRATVLTLAALEKEGIEDPERNVVVLFNTDFLGEEYATVLARRRPFTPDELQSIQRLANERGKGVVFAPGGPYVDEWKELADAPDWRSFCEDYRLNVCPVTDDKPFFFNQTRLGQLGSTSEYYLYSVDPFTILMVTLGILVVLAVLALLLPLRLARGVTRPTVGSLSYFVAIGLGFLLLEIVLIQRFVLFLGFPTYALSVVLFALLISSGIGSALTARYRDPRRALLWSLGAVMVLAVLSAFLLQPLLRGMISLPFATKVLISVVFIAPLGIALGAAMPIGLRRFEPMYPASVPYAWGVNGVASVLASVLGVAAAINYGFAITSLIGAVCYVGALVHAAYGRWPQGDEAIESSPPVSTAAIETPAG
jgi:hypothetical protein